MGKYIHLFETETEYGAARRNDYKEPWVSLTEANGEVNYNKSEYEKLLGTPLTFEIISGGYIVWAKATTAFTLENTIQYSKNGGEWISITANKSAATSTNRITVVSGDIVQFRGDNNGYGSTSTFYNTFGKSTARFKISGNIMSLLNSTDFYTLTTLPSNNTFNRLFASCTGLTDASELKLPASTLTNRCYSAMFSGCKNLTNAPKLAATTLAEYCYSQMFSGCTSLTQAPVLPATTLANYCYQSMFYDCSGLTQVPELPATTLAEYCYGNMFGFCTSLTGAQASLPATTLAYGCYNGMFSYCSNLTQAPELPATTLGYDCYRGMFYGCSKLTRAPELPAVTLVANCYWNMFYGCGNLNYIKCLATDISATDCTYNWVYGVQTTSGTFVKPASTDWSSKTGNNGIPAGWAVQDA